MIVKITTPESERIESEISSELKEAANFLGGWDKLRELIQILEQNEKEADFERAQSNY
jgi:excinuclease UvrABC nuclease subunit